MHITHLSPKYQAMRDYPCIPSASSLWCTSKCDRVLLEIPTAMLGCDMLMATEFAALSTGPSKYAPGTSVANRVVRGLRRGNCVYADIPRFDAWARNSSSLQEGIQEAALPVVLAAF